MMEPVGKAPRGPAIEARSIDYVPVEERHGQARDLGPVWFQGNAALATLAVGLIGPSLGLSFTWAMVAIVLGTLIGTLFMAFHSAQGPKLGLPQMIQSRPQFGYYGALLPMVMALLLFIGFNTFNTIIGGQAVADVTSLPELPSTFIIALAASALSVVGYNLIHVALRWATYLFLVIFSVFTIGIFVVLDHPASFYSLSNFDLTIFLVQMGAVMGYQLTWAPYVSEYSRYLPNTSSTRATFGWTYTGSSIGAIWLMGLGAYVLSSFPELGPIAAVRAAGDAIIPGFGWLLLLAAWPGLIAVISMNMYSGSLTGLSIVDTVRRVPVGIVPRVVGIAVVALAGTSLALYMPADFLTGWHNFLLLVLYFMIPWTAVNLVDFFFVRREQYAILEIYRRDGLYGKWGTAGIVSYFAGFAAMIPFFSTGDLYTGPAAEAINGADVSPFIGFPVAAIVYFLMTRDLDLAHERRIIDNEAEDLQRLATEERPLT